MVLTVAKHSVSESFINSLTHLILTTTHPNGYSSYLFVQVEKLRHRAGNSVQGHTASISASSEPKLQGPGSYH